jgi:hypothetical protein
MDELEEHVHRGASVSSMCYGSVRGAFQLIESLGDSEAGGTGVCVWWPRRTW